MKNIKTYVEVVKESIVEGDQGFLDRELIRAAEIGLTDACSNLIDRGADVNARNEKKWTPLFAACVSGYHLTAKLLLDRGADTELTSEKGYTPLHAAIAFGNYTSAKLLIERGANIEARNPGGDTPLYIARSRRESDIAMLLIQGGADPFTAFENAAEILEFFKGDIDWMSEGPLKTKLKRMQRGKSAFGM
jgi:hypothetical protein